MIKSLNDLPAFFRFTIKYAKVIIFMLLCVVYLLMFRFMKYQSRDTDGGTITTTDYEILKLVDIVEYVPPPKPVAKPEPKVEENVVQVEDQPAAAENIIEVEEKVEEIQSESPVDAPENASHNVGGHVTGDIDYFPQNKISKVPQLPAKEILSKIVYPQMAHRQGIEGVVYLELYIDAEGNIRKIVVLKDPGYGFAEAAVAAMEGIKCIPAQANGVNVPVRFRYPVKFKLN